MREGRLLVGDPSIFEGWLFDSIPHRPRICLCFIGHARFRYHPRDRYGYESGSDSNEYRMDRQNMKVEPLYA